MMTTAKFVPSVMTCEQASEEEQVSSRLADERVAQQSFFL